MSAWREDDFTTKVVYQFRDRDGCQADIRSTIVVDVVGAPIWERHTGRSCPPSREIDESYNRSGSMGIWKRPEGQGEGDVIGKKFYTSAAGVPEERALLVRALLASGNVLRLLPDGEARLTLIRAIDVTARGRAQTVTGYRIGFEGVRYDPVIVWLDTRGELFAVDDNVIREDWESVVAELRRAGRQSATTSSETQAPGRRSR